MQSFPFDETSSDKLKMKLFHFILIDARNFAFLPSFWWIKLYFPNSLDVIFTNDQPWKMRDEISQTNDKHPLRIALSANKLLYIIQFIHFWKFSYSFIFSGFVCSVMHLFVLYKKRSFFVRVTFVWVEYILTLLWLLFWRFPAILLRKIYLYNFSHVTKYRGSASA